MKKHLTPQTLIDCYSMGIVLVLLVVTGIFWREHHYSKKFDQTPSLITLDALKSQWGEPDDYKGNTSRMVVFYDRSICGKYFFIFDKDSILTAKGIDD